MLKDKFITNEANKAKFMPNHHQDGKTLQRKGFFEEGNTELNINSRKQQPNNQVNFITM